MVFENTVAQEWENKTKQPHAETEICLKKKINNWKQELAQHKMKKMFKHYTLNRICSLMQVKLHMVPPCSLLDPGVQFICGLSDVDAIINETAELTCKLSSEDCEGAWFRDGKKVSRKGQTHHFLCSCVGVKDATLWLPADLRSLKHPSFEKVSHIHPKICLKHLHWSCMFTINKCSL